MMPDHDEPNSIHLTKVWQSVTLQQRLRTEYFSPTSGLFSERSIEPIGTVRYGGVWHVIAYCCLRHDFRDFRLDRMSKLALQAERFEQHDQETLLAYLQRQTQMTDATLVKVVFDKATADSVRDTRAQQGFMTEAVGKSNVEMWFLTGDTQALRAWSSVHGGNMEVN